MICGEIRTWSHDHMVTSAIKHLRASCCRNQKKVYEALTQKIKFEGVELGAYDLTVTVSGELATLNALLWGSKTANQPFLEK